MGSPWLDIPLADYEAHMALPSVGQAGLLADLLDTLLQRYTPRSLALFGCSGGNGLERVQPQITPRVVGIDINPAYIQTTAARHAARLPGLELYVADVQSADLSIAPVELIYAALLFEYVDPRAALLTLARTCCPGGILAAVQQLSSPHLSPVSPSPYAGLEALAPVMRLHPPDRLAGLAAEFGFALQRTEEFHLPSGKRFGLQVFKHAPAARSRERSPTARHRTR